MEKGDWQRDRETDRKTDRQRQETDRETDRRRQETDRETGVDRDRRLTEPHHLAGSHVVFVEHVAVGGQPLDEVMLGLSVRGEGDQQSESNCSSTLSLLENRVRSRGLLCMPAWNTVNTTHPL